MELALLIGVLLCPIYTLYAVYLGYKLAKGEKIVSLPKKMAKSIKTEAQQAALEKKLLDEKDIRRY